MAGDMGTMMESVTDYPGTLVTLSGEQNQRSNSIQHPRGRLCAPNDG